MIRGAVNGDGRTFPFDTSLFGAEEEAEGSSARASWKIPNSETEQTHLAVMTTFGSCPSSGPSILRAASPSIEKSGERGGSAAGPVSALLTPIVPFLPQVGRTYSRQSHS